MAERVSVIKAWIDTLDPDDSVAVDDGGLTLVVVEDQEDYYEIGGVPLCEGCEDGCTLADSCEDRLCADCRGKGAK